MSEAPAVAADNPSLSRNRSFHCFVATESLGAFNDNVFKQVVLLLCVGHVVAGFDFQMIVQFLFALPFLLFSGLAGDIADRYSKGKLMVIFKIAEILAMLLSLAAFSYAGSSADSDGSTVLWLLAGVTFLMGAQSAFFGPPKYAGIPEMVRQEDLGLATGIVQMTTFLSIVLGFAFAGFLMDNYRASLNVPGMVTVGIAILGTLTSLGIRRRPASAPDRRLTLASMVSTIPVLRRMIRDDRLLFDVMVIYSWFWLVGAVALTAINNYGLFHLGLSNLGTSQMVALVSIGMAAGSLLVGRMSAKKVRIKLIIPGLGAMVAGLLLLLLLPVPHATESPPLAPLAVRVAAFAIFFTIGGGVGFFTVPLIALVQSRPKPEEKGQVLAAFNWLSWLFIVAAAGVYGVGMLLCGGQAHYLLGALGALTLIVGIVMIPGIIGRLREEKPDYVEV